MRATNAGNGAVGGQITIVSTEGTVTAGGLAVNAGAQGIGLVNPPEGNAAGGDGGKIVIEALKNIVLDTAKLTARGDNVPTIGIGGTISVRSATGTLSWQNGVGDVRPTGQDLVLPDTGVPLANRGVITLQAAGAVTTTNTLFPFVQPNANTAATTPTIIANTASGAPTLPEYVVLPVCETGQASPTISTLASPMNVTLSTSSVTLNDSATLSGGLNPTGTITFTLYDPSNVAVYTDVVTVNGNDSYDTSMGNNPGGYTLPTSGTVTGTYQWLASYSGDANNYSALYVTNPGNGTLGEYNFDGTPVNAALISGLTGYPEGVAIALSGSHLFIANFNGGTIGEYNLDGSIVNATLISGLNQPSGLALSGTNLFVTNFGSGTIGEYQLDGTPVNTALISGLNGPAGLTASGSDLYVANLFGGTIGKYTTSGATVNAALISGLNGPIEIAVSGSNLFETNYFSGTIGEYTTSGATVNAALVSGLSAPIGIAFTGSNLFVTSQSNGTIGKYNLDGSTVNAALISGLSAPNTLAVVPISTIKGDEPVVVSAACPTISTLANPMNVTLSTSSVTLNDSAMLSGGYHETGTITFTLYDPSNLAVYTDVVTVNGNGSYDTSMGNNPGGYTLPMPGTVTGTYQWVASYSGDGNNKAKSSIKGDEPVVVSLGNVKICGHKYEDTNGDGLKNDGNPGLAGWTIILDDNGNNMVDPGEKSAITDANGFWSISGVSPGMHIVTEVSQTGWVNTYAPGSFTVTNTDVSGLDFGNYEQTSIHGYKFNDLNGNGVDNSDPRLAGWTILLVGTDGQGHAVSTSTVTVAGGEYSFTGLAPGTYTVSEQAQTGWTQTAGGATFTLTSGQEAVAYCGEAGTLLPGQTEVARRRSGLRQFRTEPRSTATSSTT